MGKGKGHSVTTSKPSAAAPSGQASRVQAMPAQAVPAPVVVVPSVLDMIAQPVQGASPAKPARNEAAPESSAVAPEKPSESETASESVIIPQCSGRALAVYLLALALLALLESARLQTFLEQTDVPGAEQAAMLVREVAHLSGAMLVSNAETRLVRQLEVNTRLGATAPAAPQHRTMAALAQTLPAAPSAAFVPPLPQRAMAEATPPQPAVRQADVPSVLIVGDSLIMEGLGPALHRTLRKRTDITVRREGRYSTGLTRTDTFNWPDRIRELVNEHNPDIILVCLGANDSQDILVDGKRHIAGTPSWQTLYRERADRFLSAATSRGATVIWLGLPIMGKPPYEKRIRLLSDLQEAACMAEPLCRFQNGLPVLADAKGNYLAFVLDENGQHVRLRYKDMVHVTEAGGQKLVDAAAPLMDQAIADVKAGVKLESTPVAPSSSSTTQPPAATTPPPAATTPPPAPTTPPPAASATSAVPPTQQAAERDALDALLK